MYLKSTLYYKWIEYLLTNKNKLVYVNCEYIKPIDKLKKFMEDNNE